MVLVGQFSYTAEKKLYFVSPKAREMMQNSDWDAALRIAAGEN